MSNTVKNILLFISISILGSCSGDDPTKISENFLWEPTYSFPVSQVDIGVENFKDSLSFLEYYTENEEVIINDTIDFSYGNVADYIDKIQTLLYRFYIVNEFPSDIELYAFFYDETGNQIGSGSVFEESPEFIDIPQIDIEGNITEAIEATLDIDITEEYIDSYRDLSKVILVLHFKDLNTEENIINRLNDYSVSVSLGIRAELSVYNL